MISSYEPTRPFVISLLICLCLSSILIRAYYIKSTFIPNPVVADARQYVIYGYNLTYNGVFSKQFSDSAPSPDSYRSPGYPLVVALSFVIGGKQGYYEVLLYSQAIIGGFLSVLTYWAAILFLPFTTSIAAAILVAFNPHLISMTSYCLTETLFSFTFLSGILCFFYSIKSKNFFLLIAAAILSGYSYLVNETMLFLPYLFALTSVLIFKNRLNNNVTNKVIVFLIIFSIFPCAWMIRNLTSLPPNALRGESRALSAMTHGSYLDFTFKTEKYKYYPYREDPEQPEFGSSVNNFFRILWKRVKQKPYDYILWYTIKKPFYLWSWNILQGQGDIYIYPVKQSLYSISKFAVTTKNIIHGLHPFFMILSFCGIPLIIFQLKKNTAKFIEYNHIAIFFYVIFIYYTLLYTVFAPWPRYSVPLRPVFYICALWSLDNISRQVRIYFNKNIAIS